MAHCTQIAANSIHRDLEIVVWFASFFWSFFVFDMVGDVHGIMVAFPFMIGVAFGGPLLYYLFKRLCDDNTLSRHSSIYRQRSSNFEMGQIKL